MEYTIEELEMWDKKIRRIVNQEGLDCYPQEFEICSYEDMLSYEAYIGMPSHYPHWSYGKAYERRKTFYKYNLQGLPYEMVINSNPCIAYLMRDNTLLLQIFTMAHVYGHNDFFKNNNLFALGTRAHNIIQKFKNHAKRIRGYIGDPSIGYQRVERILDAAHAIRFQTNRVIGEKRLSEDEQKKSILDNYYSQTTREGPLDDKKELPFPDLSKVPLEPAECLLGFLVEHGKLEDWEKDIMQIVVDETEYFIPQIETKIMNEGWASYWHYEILNQLGLPDHLHLEFLSRHNQVIRPLQGAINPYYMGFKIFLDLAEKHGKQKIFEVRKLDRDQSFIRRYLTEELCREMNLFQFKKRGVNYVVEEVPDESGWREIRNTLANDAGMGFFPSIKVVEVDNKDNSLLLLHEYDGRELELTYAQETLKYLVTLWGGKVKLKTVMNTLNKTIICDGDKKVTINNEQI